MTFELARSIFSQGCQAFRDGKSAYENPCADPEASSYSLKGFFDAKVRLKYQMPDIGDSPEFDAEAFLLHAKTEGEPV